MNNDIAIQFDHVGKLYHLGVVGTGTLVHDLNRWWQTSVLHHEDPYLKIGQTNDRASKGSSDIVYALRDITFDVRQGDVVGIIGKNGAGKSTLLKLLSRVTSPSTGVIRARGRIGSLLEVGTGFHPELTGRENIYMNGSIMGMTKKEIDRKLDEIVDFAGVERYIDTPVKRYSSGMTVRLGFAVAAFMEPEILVVDEVLAVGDAEFQKKAIGKMQDVSKGGGRTVLFVSHNMAAVRSLCNTGVLLQNGVLVQQGEVNAIVDSYINQSRQQLGDAVDLNSEERRKQRLYVSSFQFLNAKDEPTTRYSYADKVRFSVSIKSSYSCSVTVRVAIFDMNETRILTFDSSDICGIFSVKDELTICCQSDDCLNIRPGVYKANVSVRQGANLLDHVRGVAMLEVLEEDFYGFGRYNSADMPISLKRHTWKIQ